MKGMEIRGDLPTTSLYLSIPQAYLEYTDENWDPPSRWDEGVAGLLLDYNLNASSQHQQSEGSNTQALSGNGTAGGNLGSWRFEPTGRPI